MKNSLTLTIVIIMFSSVLCFAQETVLYKQIDSTKLFLEIYYPNNMGEGKEYPATISFHWSFFLA